MSDLKQLPMAGTLDAIMTIEGGNPSEKEYYAAFQTLLDSGIIWSLQGWYGREAQRLIAAGHICREHPE